MIAGRLTYFIAISLLVHLLLALLYFSQWFSSLIPHKAHDHLQPAKTLKIVKIDPPHVPIPAAPPQKQFVPTMPSQESDKIDPNTLLESERNTALRSHELGTVASELPQLSGPPIPGINYVDTPASVNQKSQYSPPAPPATQAPKDSPNPPTKPSAAAKPSPTSTPVPPAPSLPVTPQPQNSDRKTEPETPDPNANPVLAPTSNKPAPTTNPQPESQPPAPSQTPSSDPTTAPPPAPPPSLRSTKIDHSKIDGSNAIDPGDPSPSSKESELGAYKARLYRAIGSRWYLDVEKFAAELLIGSVKIRFFVRANGVIEQIQVTGRSGESQVLETISRQAIQRSQPFNVFSDHMKQQLGEGYWDEITFSIY